jgi:hypothetical protein
MASCAEAAHYLFECKVKELDRNGNGTPCERLCIARSEDTTDQKKQVMCDRIKGAPMFMSPERQMTRARTPSGCNAQ